MNDTPTNVSNDREADLVYTLDEAGARLKVSKWTINRLVQTREIPSIQIGARRLIPADAITNFVARQRTDTQVAHA